jgi:flavin reductase (DIM6/NTAB) family NADH-FMN oxidoreductase RutF
MRKESKSANPGFTYPVGIITVRHDGKQNGMTAAWLMPVSIAPLIYCTSVGLTRYTHELMDRAPSFGINILSDGQSALANLFGKVSGKKKDKLSDPSVKLYEASKIDCPMLDGCIANIECNKIAGHTHGDHTLFIGEALRCETDEEKKPLLYSNMVYYTVGNKLLDR